jgi:hypothetical protein
MDFPNFASWTLALSEQQSAIWVCVYAAIVFTGAGWLWYKLIRARTGAFLLAMYISMFVLIGASIALA